MSRLIPHPLLSAGLLAMWLLLNRPSPGHLLLGGALALFAGWALAALEPRRARPRRPGAMLRLGLIVFADILRSNAAVVRAILADLAGRGGARRPCFAEIALRLEHPAGLAVLAMIVTATPGTAWIDHDPARRLLVIHILDARDREAACRRITDTYEALLLEIFP